MAETKTNTEDGGSKLRAEMNTERAGSHSHGLGVDLNSISNLSSLPAMASSTSIPGILGARPESILSPEQAFVSAEQAFHATELVKEFYRLLKVPLGAAAPSPGWAGFRREEDGEIPSCFSCRKPETEGKTVICDSCERSFHMVCVKMKPRQATELDEWVCSRCEAEGVRPRFPLGKRLGPEIGEPRFSHESCLKVGDEGNAKDDVQAKKRGFETNGNGDGDSASPLNQDKDAFTASPGMSCKERPRRSSVVAMACGDGDGYRDRDRNRDGDGDLKLPTVAFSVQESNIEPLNQGKGTFVRPLTMSMADGDGHGGGNGDSTLATSSFPSKEGNIEPLNQGKGIFASSPIINHKEFPRKSPTIAMADGDADSTTPTIAFPPKEGNMESLYQGTNRKERLRRPKRERDAEEDYPGMVKRVPLEASVSVGSEDIKLRASSRLKALYSGKDDITKEVEPCTADQVLSESGNDETTINSSSRRGKGKGVLRKDFHDTKLQCSDEEGEYIQKLRDFIEQQGGFLEDGWYLKIRRRPNGEKEIFYYSHDGQKFRSRKEVARFLGVLDWKKEDLDQRDNATSLLNSRRFIGVQKRVQESEGESDSDEDELLERQKFEVETSESEDEHFEPDIEVDLPLECMDLRIESLGTIVQHSESQEQDPIWPVGYRSSWHDSITASVFTSEVLDKGSAGPVFCVTRKSCSDFANLGDMEASKNEEKESSLVSASRLKSDAIYDEDYELGMLLGNLTGPLVTEDCVMDFLNFPFYHDVNPCENIHKFNPINGEAEGGSKTIETMNKDADSDFLRQLFVKAEDNECMDLIGEVSVEGPTPIEAWAAMGKQIFAHLQEISMGARSFKFGCSHSEMRPLSPGSNPVDILETLGMETAVANGGDCNPLLITLRDWVGQDRFGFDIPVVQKLIARKPKVKVIRPPPPPGDPIGSKILDEGLVGDLLQIWEFLCRFSEILGLKDVQSLQDLEEALCMGMGSSVISPSGGEQTGSDCREEKAKIQNVVRKKSTDLLSVSSSPPVGLDNIVLSSIHISLLRILLPELEQKLLGMSDLTLEAKQGKKKDVEPVISSTKGLTEGLVILNEATWPEVARRYIMAMLSLNNGVENADLSFQERWKVLKCIQGDGGALCGGLDGSAGIEVDAQLLAEAQKKVFHRDSAEGENVPTLENEEEDEVLEASGKPEWVSLLEPVRKLATNVGARIRNCIRDALEKDPPEWAKEMLEWSISKDVYKGNASGPTKRAVLSVLEKAAGLEKPLSPKKPKVKKVQPVLTISPEFIMRRCRAIIRELIASDGVRVFCNMLGGTVLGYYISEQDGAEVAPAMVSCPLDFRIIDARLAAGAYGVSHESFAADMQQLWTNLNTVFQDKPEMIKVGQSLFQQFESLYKEKVLDLVNYVQEQAAKSLGEEDTSEENTPVIPEIKEEELLKAHWEWGVCKICGVDKDDDKVLLCDECDAEYHIYCLVPPLSKIPQGNWYCPTCVAGGKGVPSSEDIICRRVSRLSRAVSTDEGRALQSLAGAIVEKDYWDLGVSDKIRLLKFLCDKALDSNAIIENFDQYMDASLELQQKLYSLYEERKNAALEVNTQQIQGIDLGKKPLQSMGGSNGEEALYKPEAKVLRSRDIDLNCIAGTSDQGLIMTEELILEGEKKDSNIRDSGINPGERIPLPISEGDQVKEANAVEGAPSQTISELIEMQIDKLEMEAMRMAMRREWLGRDLLNRHYWVLGWEGKLPWLVVDESGGSINEWASKLSNGSMTEKPNNTLCESDKKRWMSYESDVGLERLLEWLRPTSRREQELKDSILRWRMSLLKGNGRSSANKDIVQRPLGRPRLITIVPATKAALFLVKRFGPIYWPDGDDGLLGGGRKRARPKSMGQSDECLFRCECLEIVWPSRCHCQGCHQTFDSTDELHSHDGGDCFSVAATAATAAASDLANTPSLKTNKKKGGDGRSKKLKNAFEGTIKLKISKKQAKKFAFMAPDFEEILKVFKLPTSNQDRVRQIGFIAEETPAFAPTLSYSPIFDSLLTKSGKIKARGDHKGARLVEITNLGSILNVVEDGKRQKQACLKPKDVVVTPSKSAEPETPDTKGETASPNPQSSNGEEGGSTSNYTIPVRSLQPLSGRSLWVLRRLKANLLDMEALISLDALEPSRADPDKRRIWRSFVKSATSIFEVLQAEICLERALKADYLKETWCNWQSLSSTVQSATLSSLALRIFSLDAAIMYKKAKVVFDPNFPSKKGSSGSKKKVLEK